MSVTDQTLAPAPESTLGPAPRPARGGRFFVWMAGVCVLIPLVAFAPSYWLQAPRGTVVGETGLHVHAVIFACWPLLFFYQSWLGARGQIARHRALGLAGVSLATAVVWSGVASVGRSLVAYTGDQVAAKVQFGFAPFTEVMLFAGLVIAAVANVKRPEVHKRLMLLATIALMPAAVVRIMFALAIGVGPGVRPGIGEPPPVFVPPMAMLIADLLIVAVIVYDWRARGRPHRATLIGGGAMLAAHLLAVPLGATPVWQTLAPRLFM